MGSSSSVGIVKHIEDFVVDNINTSAGNGVVWVTSADSGDTAFVRAVAAARGLHAAGAISAANDQMIEFCTDELMIYVQQGFNAFEVMFQIDDITNIAFNIGFNDDSLDASNTLPAELATATWTFNAATFVGVAFDTDATNADVHCVWVDTSVAAAETLANLRLSGCSLAASQWIRVRVELQDRGSGNGARATFNVTYQGKSFEKTFNTTITRSTALCPYIAFETRSASVHNVYLKLPIIEMGSSD